MVLSESGSVDIDRLLMNLEVKEFSVEASTLQSLQQLIQWVADLALNILAKLPDNRGMSGMNRNSGVCIQFNSNCVQTEYFIIIFYLYSMILAKILSH